MVLDFAVVRDRLGLTMNEEDKERLDRLRGLLRELHGFAPENYADLVRAAIDFFVTAKEREWEERHPGSKLGVRPRGR